MKIEDKRSDTLWVPATSILEEFIPKVDRTFFIGIKNIILLDEDFRANSILDKANGRYIQISGTNLANIELYFDRFTNLPDEAKRSRLYLVHTILSTLLHELYHHQVRGLKKKRKPRLKKEQSDANIWARKILEPIILENSQGEKNKAEWDLIQKKIQEHRWKTIQEIKSKLNSDEINFKEKLDLKKLKKLMKRKTTNSGTSIKK